MQHLGSALSQRRAEIADTSAELRDVRNELETRVVGFGVVEARLLETTVEARRLKVENDRRDVELSQLTRQLIAQEEALRGEVAALRDNCGTLATELATREAELTAAELHRIALLQSTSWRLTAPARWVIQKLRHK